MAKPAKDPKADAEFQAALKLFQQGKLAEAEKEFAKIAKNRKGTPWGENAQYYLAETQFQRKKYVNAHDSFELLHNDYPATEYLDKLVSREYAIAQLWLAQADPKAPKDKADSLVRPLRRPAARSSTPRGTASRPSSTSGTTIPTGPLADDAAHRDRRVLHEASRLRVRRTLLRPVHRRVPQEPVPPEGPARRDRRPDERLPRARVRRVRPRESARPGQEDHGRPSPSSRPASRSSITRST